ncbi:MAG: sel1 repeat family protein [Deltaproteobacteria bacterium]|nr:sel1 repeat family protein [Deltaproteobacteria bacterium]
MVGRRPIAGGGTFRRPASLLAVVCAVLGCGKRSAEAPAADGPSTATATDVAEPSDVVIEGSPDVPASFEAVEEDAVGEVEEVAGDAAPAVPEWPETPLVVLQEPAALERACRRRDWAACVALADRLADGPAGERDEARADELYVRACDQGRRGDACRRLGLRRLRAGSTPAGGREAAARLEQACNAGFLDACEVLGALQVRGEWVPCNVYVGLQRLQRACNAGYAAACATVRTFREVAESYDLPLPRAVGPEPVEPGKEPAAEAVCPALFHGAAAVAFFEHLDRDLVRLSPAALAEALPEAVEGWTVERGPVRDGDSFLRGTVVGARFVAGDRAVELVVRDRVSECTLQPGTGAAMLERTGRGAEDRRTVRVRGEPAVLAGPRAARVLTWWVAERCEVRWTASNVPDDRLLELARTPDLGALRRECARRETADGTAVYEP